jgi:transposase
MPQPNAYPREFRREAVRLFKASGRSQRAIAGELGITQETLRVWIRQAAIDAGEHNGLSSSEREELRALRRRVKILEEEREVLKKAAAFFVAEEQRARLRGSGSSTRKGSSTT